MSAPKKRTAGRTGRPPLPEGARRRTHFILRVSLDEKAAIEAAAEHVSRPASEWAREVLLDAAAATIVRER